MFKKGGKKAASDHAAVWVPDSEANSCMVCKKSNFNVINRRVSTLIFFRKLLESAKSFESDLILWSAKYPPLILSIETGERLGSSCFSMSRDKFECRLSLGHTRVSTYQLFKLVL